MTGAGVCEHVRPQTHKERWRAYAWQTAFYAIYTRHKAGMAVVIWDNKRCGAAPLPCLGRKTLKRARDKKEMCFSSPSKRSAASVFRARHISSLSTTKLAGQTTHPKLGLGSVIFEPLLIQSPVWTKTQGDPGVLALVSCNGFDLNRAMRHAWKWINY